MDGEGDDEEEEELACLAVQVFCGRRRQIDDDNIEKLILCKEIPRDTDLTFKK